MVHLSHPYMTTWKTIALTIQTFVSKVTVCLRSKIKCPAPCCLVCFRARGAKWIPTSLCSWRHRHVQGLWTQCCHTALSPRRHFCGDSPGAGAWEAEWMGGLGQPSWRWQQGLWSVWCARWPGVGETGLDRAVRSHVQQPGRLSWAREASFSHGSFPSFSSPC